MSLARERAAKEADRPGLALDIRRSRMKLAQRYARECLPVDAPGFPHALYLKPHVQDASARAVLADMFDERVEQNDLVTRGCYGREPCAGPNYAYGEFGYTDWTDACPWARAPSLWWATDALARGVDPAEVKRVLAAAWVDERAGEGPTVFDKECRRHEWIGALAVYDVRIINPRFKP